MSLGDHSGISLGSLWDHFGINLGPLWEHFDITKGSSCGDFAITLGTFWDHFWGHLGITLGTLTTCSGLPPNPDYELSCFSQISRGFAGLRITPPAGLPDYELQISHRPAGQPESRTGTGYRVLDNWPGNQKTGPGPDAGYRITGQETGKPDWDRMLGTG